MAGGKTGRGGNERQNVSQKLRTRDGDVEEENRDGVAEGRNLRSGEVLKGLRGPVRKADLESHSVRDTVKETSFLPLDHKMTAKTSIILDPWPYFNI